uniref:Ketoreductase domain-containing protein n=1 Tax=Palpitomonas bilix TaxID=652834 RepID=A0A7S3DD26_9EUKA|mmetsp:Transcript_32459/g.84035  ORF Transcript_32459/g.84035 Transcript_32459/m.84035 type:complete len:313 (+) Transcript_32459:50-988(+)
MDKYRYDSEDHLRVAIITGAGGGLGRAHALLLAQLGCAVVVNDLGVTTSGEGKSEKAADKVVNEIQLSGGRAVANYDSVVDGDKIVQCAIDHFGRVDIVVNNAGILRDTSFQRMGEKQWDIIFDVHVKGAFSVTKAAWRYMKEQGFGRVVMTSSSSGLYGNYGQANYGAAKMALLGFANSLAIEGQRANILVNTIAPIALSRMTKGLIPEDFEEVLKPEFVSPLVAYLCHPSCEENGSLFEVGGGWIAKVRLQRSLGGIAIDEEGKVSVASVADNFEKMCDFDDAETPSTNQEAFVHIMEAGEIYQKRKARM